MADDSIVAIAEPVPREDVDDPITGRRDNLFVVLHETQGILVFLKAIAHCVELPFAQVPNTKHTIIARAAQHLCLSVERKVRDGALVLFESHRTRLLLAVCSLAQVPQLDQSVIVASNYHMVVLDMGDLVDGLIVSVRELALNHAARHYREAAVLASSVHDVAVG